MFSDSFYQVVEWLSSLEFAGILLPLREGEPAILDLPIGYIGEYGYPSIGTEICYLSSTDMAMMYNIGLERLARLKPSPEDFMPWYKRVLEEERASFLAALNLERKG